MRFLWVLLVRFHITKKKRLILLSSVAGGRRFSFESRNEHRLIHLQ